LPHEPQLSVAERLHEDPGLPRWGAGPAGTANRRFRSRPPQSRRPPVVVTAAWCARHLDRRGIRAETPLPPGPGRDLLPGGRRDRLGGAPARLPARQDHLRPLPPLGRDRGLAPHPRRLARPGRRRHEGRDPAPAAAIIASQSLLGADMSPRLARTRDWW